MPFVNDPILLIHLMATTFLTGLIWFVQVAHYPLLHQVGPESFAAYERKHIRRTTWIVVPAMLVEAATAGLLVYRAFRAGPPDLIFLNSIAVALLLGIWLSTAIVQAPCHRQLENGYDERVVNQLVLSNWLRAGMWTVRCALAVAMIL